MDSPQEHSHYLEALTWAAVRDGADRIVTLHPDSFPIKDGWEHELFSRLSDDVVVGTLEKVNTACLFFRADFWTRSRPRYLMPPFEQDPSAQTRFLDSYAVVNHSGTGLLWAAFLENRRAVLIPEDMVHPMYGRFCGFYGGVLFHLGGVARFRVERVGGPLAAASAVRASWASRPRLVRAVERWAMRAARLVGRNDLLYRLRPRSNGGRAYSASSRVSATSPFFIEHVERDYLRARQMLTRDADAYLSDPARYHHALRGR